MTYSYPTQIAQYPRRRARTSGALIVADIIALIGVVVGCVSLFLHGWVHASISFVSRGPSGAQLLQSFGIDVDRQLMQIADREINASIAPTMWAYKNHVFQLLFAVLVLTGVLLLIGLAAPRVRVAMNALALLTSIGAVCITVIALTRLRDNMDSLPAQVGRAVLASSVGSRVLGLTTGTPKLTSGPGWPLYAALAGVGIAFLGALFALIFAARSSRTS